MDPKTEPIIESFEITNLNGYKHLGIWFTNDVKIIAAENGSGKTTLLNAMHAVLRRNFYELVNLSFSHIYIKLRGHERIEIDSNDILYLSKKLSGDDNDSDAILELNRFGLSFDAISKAAENFETMDLVEFRSTPEFDYVWEESPWSMAETYDKFGRAASELIQYPNALQDTSRKLQEALGEYKVLYLPTYRRIEAQVPGLNRGRKPRPRRGFQRRRSTHSVGSDSLINFGLNDVRDKLRDITVDIQQQTANAYSMISGRTLDQLLKTGKFDEVRSEEFDVQNLGVVLARLGKTELYAPLAELIQSGAIDDPRHDYLRYFLAQMLQIYRTTQSQEEAIENFVNVVSTYWKEGAEEKILHYDKVSLKVSVENVFTHKELNLNALSSGEKQMVSMFSKIYLNPTQKYIVLIDEPELSLSIDWQRKFLPDIYRAESCAQLLAITHSPFIFDNDLDKYAGALKVDYVNSGEAPE